jgi:sigma-B regulation protein RsbU (phosphoserine phosphatase)
MNTLEKRIEALEQENERLHIAIEELSVLNDITLAITSTQEENKIIDLIVHKCVKHLNVEQGAVMLLDEKDLERPFHTMIRKQDTVKKGLPIRLNTELTGWMMLYKKPLLINNFKEDPRFNCGKESDLTIHSLICVPMLVKAKLIGILTVFNKKSGEDFSLEDQRLLSIIASQSSQVIESARLYKKEQALLRIEEEMRLAADIQQKLLPIKPPKICNYQLSGISLAAKEVGGDYFDFIPVDESRMAICLGDVSGKGIPAALLMANLQATLRGQTNIENSPAVCLEKSNECLYHNTDMHKYATLFYAVLDSRTHTLNYCNGGHDRPYFCPDASTVKRLATGGIPLGFLPQFTYSEERFNLDPGQLIVMYSDGITEAMNADEEEFGEDRLEKVIRNNSTKNAYEILEIILNSIREFVKDVPQMDDQTVVILKRTN